VSLNIYDALGRAIIQLVNAVREPGIYHIQFDASGLASGVYYCTMKAGSFTETKEMILAK
jgi:hypothetical protein